MPVTRPIGGSESTSAARRLRTRDLLARTGWIVIASGVVALVGSALEARGAAVGARLAWRVGFFGLLGAAISAVALLQALWRGRLHPAGAVIRAVPFEPTEFRQRCLLDPRRQEAGVVGRTGLVGLALAAGALLLWLGGVAFAPLDTTGTFSLHLGQSTSDTNPVGLRVGDGSYAHALSHEHTFLQIEPETGRVLMGALNPRTREQGEYVLSPGLPVVLERRRVSLAAVASVPPQTGLRVRAERAGEAHTLELRGRVPVSIGDTTWELLSLEPHFEGTDVPAAQVAQRSPSGERRLWLFLDDPQLGVGHGEGDWDLTPLERLYTPQVTVRLTARWVWWWRVLILAGGSLGLLLALVVPHRSWIWLGRPGDYRLRVWSLNARGSLERWLDRSLREALEAEGYRELTAIERALAAERGARPSAGASS